MWLSTDQGQAYGALGLIIRTNMAAMEFYALLIFLLQTASFAKLSSFSPMFSSHEHLEPHSDMLAYSDHQYTTQPATNLFITRPITMKELRNGNYYRSCISVTRWGKHGLTSLLIAGHHPPLDITIFIDVARNPGPDQSINLELDVFGGKFKTTNRKQYRRDQILNIDRNN